MTTVTAHPPQHRITTPEHVSFRYTIAGLVTRGMAWLLDFLILLLLKAATLFALSRAQGGMTGLAVVLLVWFLLDFGYYAWCELAWSGQSPGKRALGIRVVAASGGRLGPTEVMIRNLVRVLDTLPMLMALGAVVALLDRQHRRLGDLAAETVVVRDRRAAVPQAMLIQDRDNSFRADPAVRGRVLARVTREERDLMLELMLRRDALETPARERLFREAAAHFRRRYELPDDLAHLSDEQTVLNLALLVQDPLPGLRRAAS